MPALRRRLVALGWSRLVTSTVLTSVPVITIRTHVRQGEMSSTAQELDVVLQELAE